MSSAAAAKSFTITARGKDIGFESSLTDEEAYEKIKDNSSELAKSLSQRYEQSKRFGSEKQVAWAHYFANKSFAKQPAAASEATQQPPVVDESLPGVEMSVTRRGETINFTSRYSDEQVAGILKSKDDTFGKRLVESYVPGRGFGSASQQSSECSASEISHFQTSPHNSDI